MRKVAVCTMVYMFVLVSLMNLAEGGGLYDRSNMWDAEKLVSSSRHIYHYISYYEDSFMCYNPPINQYNRMPYYDIYYIQHDGYGEERIYLAKLHCCDKFSDGTSFYAKALLAKRRYYGSEWQYAKSIKWDYIKSLDDIQYAPNAPNLETMAITVAMKNVALNLFRRGKIYELKRNLDINNIRFHIDGDVPVFDYYE